MRQRLSIAFTLSFLYVTSHAGASTPEKTSAIGDSLTMAFAADCKGNVYPWDFLCFLGGDREALSWFDGSDKDVYSLHDRYLELDAKIVANKKAAKSGSKMGGGDNDFPIQSAKVLEQSQLPDHVEVLLGGNDICNRDCVDAKNCDDPLHDDDKWRGDVQEGLDILVQGLPLGSIVYLGGVPRVQDLYAAGIEKQKGTSRINCESLWRTFDVCRIATKSGLLNSEPLEYRLDGIAQRQKRYNEILQEEAHAYTQNLNDKNPRGIQVISDYVDESTPSTGTTPFSAQDINGGDCFHPSIKGQNKIADTIWLRTVDK